MDTRTRLLACWFLALPAPAALRAQEPARQPEPPRIAFGGTVGVVSYGTGDDANCGTGVGVVAAAAVRTRGPWLLALTGDLLLAGPLACTDIGRLETYRGEPADVRGRADFAPGARLGIRAGRALRGRGVAIEPGLAGGVLNGRVDAGSRSGAGSAPPLDGRTAGAARTPTLA